MGTRGLRNARRRVPRGCKDSRTWDARTQECKEVSSTGMRELKKVRMQGLENAGTQEGEDAGMQELKNARTRGGRDVRN